MPRLLGVGHVEVDGGDVQVSRSVGDGILNGTTGLTVTGNGTASVSFSGELADVNAALGTMTYKGDVDFASTDTLAVLVDDQEVIILGGLIRDKETISNSRVPVLGSIPGLGFLFRSDILGWINKLDIDGL